MTDGQIPWGFRFVLSVLGERPIPIANKNKIIRRHTPSGPRLRVQKDDKAMAYIRRLRAGFMTAARLLIKQDPNFAAIKLPIPGSDTPLRVDVYYQWSKKDNKRGGLKLSDRDNLNKGTFDALEVGELSAGIEWGLIDNDRYITEGFTAKGYAPDDGHGSRITVVVSRAGFRQPADINGCILNLAPFPPWTPQAQELITRARVIPGILGPTGQPLKKN